MCVCTHTHIYIFYDWCFRLIELEEAVEELNAAVEYKNKAIESQQMELRQSWFMTQVSKRNPENFIFGNL